MLGQMAARAGLEGRLLSVADATAAFEGYLESFKVRMADQTAEEVARRTWKDVVGGTQTTVALRLLQLLSPSAKVYICSSFSLGEGRTLKPSWTLGCYVSGGAE